MRTPNGARRTCLAVLLSLAVVGGGGAGTAGAAVCGNEQLRNEDNSNRLPDCRAYEIVSPLDKNGASVQGVGHASGGGVFQAAVDGNAATFSANSSFGAAAGSSEASQYISRRGGAGWSTENVTAASLSGAYGGGNAGVPYQLFSPDLSSALLLAGRHCRSVGVGSCPWQVRRSPVPTPPPAISTTTFATTRAAASRRWSPGPTSVRSRSPRKRSNSISPAPPRICARSCSPPVRP